MKGKEAYNILLRTWQGNKEDKDYPDFDDINVALYTIKQELERKEQLEKENQEIIDYKRFIELLKRKFTFRWINGKHLEIECKNSGEKISSILTCRLEDEMIDEILFNEKKEKK